MTNNPFDSQDFRREFEETLDKKLQPVTDLVTEHERVLQRSRGAFYILVLIWTSVVGAAEYLFHRKP